MYASSKQLGRKRIILLDNRRKIGINQIDIVKGEFLCDLVDNVHPENGSLRTADRYRNVDVLFFGDCVPVKLFRKFIIEFSGFGEYFFSEIAGYTLLAAEYLPDCST